MTFVLAVLAFPLLLAATSLGAGLLVERASGLRVPGVLLAPLGFAAIVCLTQLTTWKGAIAPLTGPIVVAAALLGFVLSRGAVRVRWRERRPGWWWAPLAGLGAYLVGIGPVLMAGRATFPGYLLDTTGAVQLIGAERLVTDGQQFEGINTGYGLQLQGYFGNGYPSGSHSALGGLGQLVGVDHLWLYAPYLAAMLGLAALVLAFIAWRAGLPRPAAAVAGLVAAVPALVYAYALQGAIKEIALLPTLLLLGALILLARELAARGPRGMIPLAVVGAAGCGTVGFAFTPWLGLAALAVLVFGLPALRGGWRPRARVVVLSGVACTALIALLALPTVAPLSRSVTQTTAVTNSNAQAAADPGNLLRPLLDAQTLGVWLGGSHRGDPEYPRATYLLIGVVLVGVGLGLAWLVRRRRWDVLAWVAISVGVWLLLDPRATTWTAAKLLVLLSPVVLLVACIGALGRLGARRIEGLLLAGAIAGGVLASDALLYHYTALAPTDRFEELRDVGERFAGTSPTLVPDFDEYATYLLRDMGPDSPGNARRAIPWTLMGGAGVGYGHSYDPDVLDAALVHQVGAIVMRRSPFRSRPPAAFRRAWRGEFYEVWLREADAVAPVARLPLGTRFDAASPAICEAVGDFAAAARREGAERLTLAPRADVVVPPLGRARLEGSVSLVPVGELPGLAFVGPARVRSRVRVERAGTYRLSFEGGVGRTLHASVDGRPVGEASGQHAGEGNAVTFGTVELTPGTHTIEIERGGGSLRPGDASASFIHAIALERVVDPALRTVPLAEWRSACGERLDWIEAS